MHENLCYNEKYIFVCMQEKENLPIHIIIVWLVHTCKNITINNAADFLFLIINHYNFYISIKAIYFIILCKFENHLTFHLQNILFIKICITTHIYACMALALILTYDMMYCYLMYNKIHNIEMVYIVNRIVRFPPN